MTPASLALLVYSAQVLVVVAVATIAAALCRLALPAALLAYWRAVGALCLMLPLISLAQPAPVEVSVVFGAARLEDAVAIASAPVLATAGAIALWIWAAGAAARVAWLALGAFHLRAIRARSTPFAASSDLDSLRSELAPRASFRWTEELTQPVTFGARRPVVLLPRRFAGLSDEAQRAVACHELLHVARRDWLWILFEEHVGALLWFHPAVWWVLEQVQLSREQVIDGRVVTRASSRRPYMDALMIFADSDGIASSAMAFLRRRHLASRLRQLSKESHMSRMHLAFATIVLVVLIGGATGGIVSTLPLDLPPLGSQSQASSRLEIRLAETEPAAGLTEARVANSDQRIYLHPAAIATSADVTSARAIPAEQSRFSVAVAFSAAASSRMASATQAHMGRPVAIVVNGQVVSAPVLRSPISGAAVLTGNFTRREAEDLTAALAPASAPANQPGRNQAASQPVSGKDPGVVLPAVATEVKPVYTAAALTSKIQGEVLLSAVVLPDGTVGDVTVTKSLDTVDGLDQQAVDAVKQWTFKPGTKDGVPVAVRVEMMMRFTLK